MSLLPTHRAERLVQAFRDIDTERNGAACVKLLLGCRRDPLGAISLQSLAEDCEVLSIFLKNVFDVGNATKHYSCRSQEGADRRLNTTDQARKVGVLWQFLLSLPPGTQMSGVTSPNSGGGTTDPPLDVFVYIPQDLYWSMVVSYAIRCTPVHIVHKRCNHSNPVRWKNLISRFLQHTVAAARILEDNVFEDAIVQTADEAESFKREMALRHQKILCMYLTPPRRRTAPQQPPMANIIGAADEFSWNIKLAFIGLWIQIKCTFFPDIDAEQPVDGELGDISSAASGHVQLQYLLALEQATTSVLKGSASGDGSPDWQPMFTGFPAVFVRQAYLTAMVDFVDSGLRHLLRTHRRSTRAVARREMIARGLLGAVAACAGTAVGPTLGVEGAAQMMETLQHNVEAQISSTSAGLTEDGDRSDSPQESFSVDDYEVRRVAAMARRDKLNDLLTQRCMSLAREEVFINMAHREDVAEELLRALATGEHRTCGQHRREQGDASAGSPQQCSRCLLFKWLPTMSDEECNAVVEENYVQTEESLRLSIDLGIGLVTKRLLSIRGHLDAIAQLSYVAQSATMLRRSVAEYMDSHAADMFDWVRERVRQYGEEQVSHLRRREAQEANQQTGDHVGTRTTSVIHSEHIKTGALWTAVVHARNARLSELTEEFEMAEKRKEPPKQFVLLVEGHLVVDANVKLPGISLIIFAEYVFVVGGAERRDEVEAKDRNAFVFDTSPRKWDNEQGNDRYYKDGKDGVIPFRDATSRDGKSGTDGESGLAGTDAGDIHIATVGPIQFYSSNEKLRFIMIGGDGEMGGRAGNGTNGEDTDNIRDSTTYDVQNLHTGSGASRHARFAVKGKFAEMPGRGGNAGTPGCGGLEGKGGKLTIQPPIPDDGLRVESIYQNGKRGQDGAAGTAGEAGGGGCDGKALVGYAELKGFIFQDSHVFGTDSFYASPKFNPGMTVHGERTGYSSVIAWSFIHQKLCQYEEHVVGRRLEPSKFVNHGVLYDRSQRDGQARDGTTPSCEVPHEHLSVNEVVSSVPRIAEFVQRMGMTMAANNSVDTNGSEPTHVDQRLYAFSDEFMKSVAAGLGLVQQALENNDLHALATHLQQGTTLSDVQVIRRAETQRQQNVVIAAPETVNPSSVPFGAVVAEDEEDAVVENDSNTIEGLFIRCGSDTKRKIPFPRFLHSWLLEDIFPEINSYNTQVAQLRKGEGNIVECLIALERVFRKMRASRQPFVRGCANSLYGSMCYLWERALFCLKGAELRDDVLLYLYPAGEDISSEEEFREHPCCMEYFGSLLYRSLAIHHARGAAASFGRGRGEYAVYRSQLAEAREKAEEFLTCPVFDITEKLRGDNNYGNLEAEHPTNLFRLFGPLLFPLDYNTERRLSVFQRDDTETRELLMELMKATYGVAKFPSSAVETLNSVCERFTFLWRASADENSPSSPETFGWLQSQANVNIFHYLCSCVASIPTGTLDLADSARYIRHLIGEVGQALVGHGASLSTNALWWGRLELMRKWRHHLWGQEYDSNSREWEKALRIAYTVLSECSLLRIPDTSDRQECHLHSIWRDMFAFVHMTDAKSSASLCDELSRCGEERLQEIVGSTRKRLKMYARVLSRVLFNGADNHQLMGSSFAQQMRSYLRSRALFYAAVHKYASLRLGGLEARLQTPDTDRRQCEECGYAFPPRANGSEAAQGETQQSMYVPSLPCVHCDASGLEGRRYANDVSYLSFLMSYAPKMATEFAVYFYDLSAFRHASSFAVYTILEMLWRDSAEEGIPDVSFHAVVQAADSDRLRRLLAEGHSCHRLDESRSHERYDMQQEENPSQLPRHLPCRTYPHNARRLRRFFELASCGEHTETLDRLVHQVGDETAHLRLASWPELKEIDRYDWRDVIPSELLLTCLARLERWRIEVSIRTFAERCYTEEKLTEHSILPTIERFSTRASTGAMRLVEHQITLETERGEYDTRSSRAVTAPFSPQVFKYVLLRLCRIPVELDTTLIGRMQDSSLNMWLPDLSKLAHHVTLSMWAPWLQEMNETCWNFGLQVDEGGHEDYLTLLRSGVKADFSSRTGNRIQILLEADSSLCPPKEKLRMGLEENPDTWRGEVEKRRRELVERRQLSRTKFGCPQEERRAFLEGQELGWGAIREHLHLSNTPVDDATLQFCKEVHEAATENLRGGGADVEESRRRFARFGREYQENYYRNIQRRGRSSAESVREHEVQLWNDNPRLKNVLVTVFLAFHQGKYWPRRVQVLSVVLLLKEAKSYLANINTAEGKTYITGCFAAVKAYIGYTPLLLSSNNALAKESQAQHEPAFRLLFMSDSSYTNGRTSFGCHVSSEDRGSLSRRDRRYAHNALYSTLHDVLGDSLKAKMDPVSWRNLRQWQESPRWLILDEADLAMAGAIADMVYVGNPRLPFFKELLGFPALLEGVLYDKPEEATMSEYTEAVSALCCSADDVSLSKWRCQQLIRSAKIANTVQNDTQFVTTDGTTCPYNIATGTTMKGSVWRDGVTSLVNMKIGTDIGHDTDTALSMTALTFLRSMRASLTGVTGTVGNHLTRVMYDNVYGMGTWRIPPAFPSQMMAFIPRIAFSDGERDDIVEKAVRSALEGGQSCVCVHDTVRESKDAHMHLERVFSGRANISLYTCESDARPQLDRSGGSAIFSCTHRGGRGLDIAINNADGLAVMLFSPQEERGTHQAERRAARQYDNGNAQRIFVDHVHPHPLPYETFEEFNVSAANDVDGFHTRGDRVVLRKQAIMLNAFYRIQNEAVMQERRRLCHLADSDIPVTLFLHSLQEEYREACQRIEEHIGGNDQPHVALKKVLVRILGCRYAKWMQENEENVMKNGNRPREQNRYLQEFRDRLRGVVERVQRRGQHEEFWSVAIDVAEDEEDIINGSAALDHDVSQLQGYFSQVNTVGSGGDSSEYVFATIPLYQALEAVHSKRWETQEGLDVIRSFLERCVSPLNRMHAALQKLNTDAATMQRNFGIAPTYHSGVLRQLTERCAFIEAIIVHIDKLVGRGGRIDFARISTVYNPDLPSLPKDTLKIVKLLLEKGVITGGGNQEGVGSADHLSSRLEEVLSFPEEMFGQDGESFSAQFTCAMGRAGGDSTIALLEVLSDRLRTSSEVAEFFNTAADGGLVEPLRVVRELFHLHDEDYIEEIKKKMIDTGMEPFASNLAALCARSVGVLRFDQIDKISVEDTTQAIPPALSSDDTVAAFHSLGLHQIISVTEHRHCSRVREEERKEMERSSWSGWCWRAAEFVVSVGVSTGIDMLLDFFPVVKGVRIGLDCVKLGFNMIKSYIKTGTWQVKKYMKEFAFSVAVKLVPPIVRYFKTFDVVKNFLSSNFATNIQRGVLYVRDTLGKATSRATSYTCEKVEKVSTKKGLTEVCTRISCLPVSTGERLFGDAMEKAVFKVAKENAMTLVYEQAISLSTETLMKKVIDGQIDSAMQQVVDVLSRELLILIRAVKQSLDIEEYVVFLRKLRTHIDESSFVVELISAGKAVLSAATTEIFRLSIGADDNRAASQKPGQVAIVHCMGAIAHINDYIDAGRLLMGSDSTKQSYVHQKIMEQIKKMWEWTEKNYTVNESAAKRTPCNEHLAADELEFVNWVRGEVKAQCGRPIARCFTSLVEGGIAVIMAIKSELVQREKDRQKKAERKRRADLASEQMLDDILNYLDLQIYADPRLAFAQPEEDTDLWTDVWDDLCPEEPSSDWEFLLQGYAEPELTVAPPENNAPSRADAPPEKNAASRARAALENVPWDKVGNGLVVLVDVGLTAYSIYCIANPLFGIGVKALHGGVRYIARPAAVAALKYVAREYMKDTLKEAALAGTEAVLINFDPAHEKTYRTLIGTLRLCRGIRHAKRSFKSTRELLSCRNGNFRMKCKREAFGVSGFTQEGKVHKCFDRIKGAKDNIGNNMMTDIFGLGVNYTHSAVEGALFPPSAPSALQETSTKGRKGNGKGR